MITIIKEIRQKGFVPDVVRKHYFSRLTIFEIRDWLESNGFDRHMPIELSSTEIALCTPEGILLQVRACDNNALGMWGGCLENNESPIDGAIRELYEETALPVCREMLNLVDMYEHTHTYANGDSVIYKTYRFVLKLNYIPEITVNFESNGFELFNSKDDIKRVLKDHREFILNLISK